MSLYESWKDLAYKQMTKKEYNEFWKPYLEMEKKNYEYILENKKANINGKLNDIAEEFGMDDITFVGFLDGLNTSLVEPLDMEKLNEESEININIDFKKLYYNMMEAKAKWLYNLPQWDKILTQEERKNIKNEYRSSKMVVKSDKIGRNDPCPCGSGKKYKKCCGKNL